MEPIVFWMNGVVLIKTKLTSFFLPPSALGVSMILRSLHQQNNIKTEEASFVLLDPLKNSEDDLVWKNTY